MSYFIFFFFNDTAPTEIYTLSLHDALPISVEVEYASEFRYRNAPLDDRTLVFVLSQSGETADTLGALRERSEEHTSELQSRRDLVCRLLLEKKNKNEKEHVKQKTSE